MKIKELIKILQGLEQDRGVFLSSDEELNVLFQNIQIAELEDTNSYVIWGNNGSEKY